MNCRYRVQELVHIVLSTEIDAREWVEKRPECLASHNHFTHSYEEVSSNDGLRDDHDARVGHCAGGVVIN